MKESVVKIPKNHLIDYDFIAFSFNGKHSYEDFGIIRVTEGNRYEANLAPILQDTVEKDNRVGTNYFKTIHEKQQFNISFAFEHLEEDKLNELKQWLNGKEIADLWFSEAPYKVYSAKIASTPILKFIPFEEKKEGKMVRVYKGEGTIQFVCYYPYAKTPKRVEKYDGTKYVTVGDGKNLDSYSDFGNVEQWKEGSNLISSTNLCNGENRGELPTNFKVFTNMEEQELIGTIKFNIGDCSIEITEDPKIKYYGFEWDSKNGLVLAKISKEDNKFVTIPYKGKSYGTIPVGGLEENSEICVYSYISKQEDENGNTIYTKITHAYKIGTSGIIITSNRKTWYENDELNVTEESYDTTSAPEITMDYDYWYY